MTVRCTREPVGLRSRRGTGDVRDRQRVRARARAPADACPLPIAEPPQWPPDVEVRAFRPGLDDEAWLAVNNRAFADDPDQRGWTRRHAAGRVAEPWFDPAGFLLAGDDARHRRLLLDEGPSAEPPDEPRRAR